MRYLIVGGGMTADAAVRGIGSADPEGEVTVIGREEHPPYDRPPLSKSLWTGMDEDRIWRGTETLERTEVLTGRSVVNLDPDGAEVEDDRGERHGYDALLLATGADPIRLPGTDEGVVYFRTLDDYRRLRSHAGKGANIAVLGGGFIGTELASALLDHGAEVTLFFLEHAPLGALLPPNRARRLLESFQRRGAQVHPEVEVHSVVPGDDGFQVLSKEGPSRGPFDLVVAGLGVRPNVGLARDAGLEVEDGIVVDPSFRTSAPRIFAAGDVAAFPFPVSGRRVRVEHEDHANQSGVMAGRAMAGEAEPYDHLPFFYSQVLGTPYEALGITDPDMEVVEVGGDHRFVVYFRSAGRVQGILLWNLRGRMREARRVFRLEGELPPHQLRERIDPE